MEMLPSLLPCLLAALLLAPGPPPGSGQCLTADDAAVRGSRGDRAALYAGQQDFATALLRELAAASPAANVFFSPHSTFQALLLAYFGAANATERSLQTALRIPQGQDKVATMQAYRLGQYLRSVSNVSASGAELSSANRLYVASGVQLRECMRALLEAELQPLDIAGDPVAATAAMNAWVRDQTRGHITDLIPGVSRDSKMVLVNAAYFKGLWASKFQAENTRKEVFHISHNKQSLVEMMKQKGNFNYMVSDRLGAHVLELPYEGQDISMFILLPPFLKSNGVEGILKRLDVGTLRELLDQDGSAQTVEVELPKWKAESTIDLVHVLENMGVGDAFRGTADYTGFTGQPDVAFDSARHKAVIEVDEDGTTAAAATAIFLFRSARPLNPARFVANHPFVYFVFDRVSQTILFAGVYRDPRS